MLHQRKARELAGVSKVSYKVNLMPAYLSLPPLRWRNAKSTAQRRPSEHRIFLPASEFLVPFASHDFLPPSLLLALPLFLFSHQRFTLHSGLGTQIKASALAEGWSTAEGKRLNDLRWRAMLTVLFLLPLSKQVFVSPSLFSFQLLPSPSHILFLTFPLTFAFALTKSVFTPQCVVTTHAAIMKARERTAKRAVM